MKYPDNQKARCFERIRDLCENLPDFCGAYIGTVATRKETSFRTGMQYAYELGIFIGCVARRNRVEPRDVTCGMLSSLLPMDIDAYVSGLASYERPDGDGTSRRLHKGAGARARNLAAVRGLYKYLLKNRLVDSNPAELAQTPLQTEKPVAALDADEVQHILRKAEATDLPGRSAAFSKKSALRDKALLTLLFHTGIRVSECAGLDIGDIDRDEMSARVLRKGGRYERVYFNIETLEALDDYIEYERETPEHDKDALFVNRFGERMSTQSINTVVKKYAAGATNKKVTAHKTRSTYATQLYRQTGDAMLVKDALGHKTLGVVQKYIAAAEENRKQAGETIQY